MFEKFKNYFILAAVVLVAVFCFYIGKHFHDNEIADLSSRLASSEKTVEIDKGLFAKKTEELTDLKDLIAKLGVENESLSQQIKKSKAEVIALDQLVLKWKNAYEAEVSAHQSVDPSNPERKRVDFSGSVGPIHVDGYTLTDPPKAFLKWIQTEPLKITVAIVKNYNGTLSTLVTTSNKDIDVDISNASFDPHALSPKWYQRLWVDGGIDFYNNKSFRFGLSYKQDKWSVGTSCSTDLSSFGCGLTLGFRIFK